MSIGIAVTLVPILLGPISLGPRVDITAVELPPRKAGRARDLGDRLARPRATPKQPVDQADRVGAGRPRALAEPVRRGQRFPEPLDDEDDLAPGRRLLSPGRELGKGRACELLEALRDLAREDRSPRAEVRG